MPFNAVKEPPAGFHLSLQAKRTEARNEPDRTYCTQSSAALIWSQNVSTSHIVKQLNMNHKLWSPQKH